MKHAFFSIPLLLIALSFVSIESRASDGPIVFMKREADNILREGDRIKREAERMRLEGTRLNTEADELRAEATQLDHQWELAVRIAGERYTDYSGRDRSQIILRSDADREDRDAGSLRAEGQRLDSEAERLWKLAADVDPRIQNSIFERMKAAGACCKTSSIEPLRREIMRLAHELGIHYVPGR
jgi:hypothetical protein